MSARRILRKNAQILKKKAEDKQLESLPIRNLMDQANFKSLSEPSSFLHIALQGNLKPKFDMLRNLAAKRHLVYISDIQVNEFFRFFTIYNEPYENCWFHRQYNNKKNYEIFANPTITKYIGEMQPTQQNCFSSPFITSFADRSNQILVNYTKIINLNTESEAIQTQNVSQTLTGFKARVFQHCIDHLQGKHPLSPQVSKGRISIDPAVKQEFKNTNFLFSQFNVRVKNALSENQLGSEEFKKVQKQYLERIRKEYKNESLKAQEKLEKHSMKF